MAGTSLEGPGPSRTRHQRPGPSGKCLGRRAKPGRVLGGCVGAARSGRTPWPRATRAPLASVALGGSLVHPILGPRRGLGPLGKMLGATPSLFPGFGAPLLVTMHPAAPRLARRGEQALEFVVTRLAGQPCVRHTLTPSSTALRGAAHERRKGRAEGALAGTTRVAP